MTKTVIHGRNITLKLSKKINKLFRAVDSAIGTKLKAIQDQNKKLAIGTYDFSANAATFTFLNPAVSIANDTITKANHGLKTGDTVLLSTAGTLPTGLSAATAYYAIYVDPSTFKLASSRANAMAGTAINITATAGSDTAAHTVKKNVFGDFNLLGNGVLIPNGAIVTRTFYKVYTTFTSPTTDNATLALTLNAANDIKTATAIKTAGDAWDAAAPVVGAQDNAIGNFLILTDDRALLLQIGAEEITAGKIKVFVEYIDPA